MRIADVEVRRYRTLWGSPLRVAWDPSPRDHQTATVVVVTADDGRTGFCSGDDLPDVALLRRHLVGLDPRCGEQVHRICATADFHGARPWIVEVACWDLAARAAGEPLWRYLGGRQDHLRGYASTAELVAPEERLERVRTAGQAGFRAVKFRLSADWRADLELLEEVRRNVGRELEILVDANHGWRMPGDTRSVWDAAEAVRCARALEALDVFWLEEPLPTSDLEGYARLRQATGMRIAAGEMVRQAHEARDLLLRGGVDVIQADVVLAGGVVGVRRIADQADLLNRWWSPHTWSNGVGLVANLHVALAFSQCPFVEVPFDPPGWSPDRRDWLLPAPVYVAEDGTIRPPDGPGLGFELDEAALASHRID